MSSVLVVEDKDGMRKMLRETLEGAGYLVSEARDGAEAIARLEAGRVDLVLTDLKLPKRDGLAVLRAAKELAPQAGVIVMTAFGTIETAVQAMKDGAADFIQKPFDSDYLLLLIKRELERRRLVSENLRLREELQDRLGLPEIKGESRRLQDAKAMLHKVAPSQATVLLLGESGTGKELFARALHQLSPRKGQPFVAINCAAIPEPLLESELFGHERGAFTGATALKPGRFERADGGTLFLDEVGELPPGVQAKLLRVLQEGVFDRVGGLKPLSVDVRIVAATNADLARLVRERRFREDLYFRLNVFPIVVPPLRERPEDIPTLAQHFLARFAGELRKEVGGFTEAAMAVLVRYPWPGNVRELENCIERAVILCGGGRIQAADLTLGIGGVGPDPWDERPQSENLHEHAAWASRRAERELIRRVIERVQGNKARAADALGVSYKTLLVKVKEYGLGPTEGEA
jgi:DNA-binding NtrC family response regulator